VALCNYQTENQKNSKTLIHPETRNTPIPNASRGTLHPTLSPAAELLSPADRRDQPYRELQVKLSFELLY